MGGEHWEHGGLKDLVGSKNCWSLSTSRSELEGKEVGVECEMLGSWGAVSGEDKDLGIMLDCEQL